ncbi:hypothetical protein FE257_012943 [Aspergillus nanangensis]|uniref:Uncharacterized protein n=1 Tax=Aspergillus nanangensis TaxID=2582783 RepID=A0AAD4CF86_ASPNN|nr:hypothetical protein FE257_012943 [Aspergillus nanangensis]
MKLISALSLSFLATTASAGAEVWVKPCYYADECETYQYDEGFSWQKGNCLSFSRGMASYSQWGSSTCRFYNAGGCTGSETPGPNTWILPGTAG